MHLIPKFVLPAVLACTLVQSASASVVISIYADRLDNQSGTPLVAGTLIQLVNLGPDGVFNPIDINDGTTSGLLQWVSGDDSVLNLVFTVDGLAGDFANTGGIDMRFSSITEESTGLVDRKFEFASIPVGTKIGMRWFPGLTAAQYHNGAGITLAPTQRYAEFTRQAGMKFGGEAWVAPADGGSVIFDALLTADGGGLGEPTADAPLVGDATLIVPEPTAIAFSLIGAAGMALLRRRRS